MNSNHRKVHYVFFLLWLLCPAFCLAQKQFCLQGSVTDRETGEPLIGVTIYNSRQPAQGSTTDADGKFKLLLPAGKYIILCSYVGYGRKEVEVDLSADRHVSWALQPETNQLEEVIISTSSPDQRKNNVQIGVEKIEISEMAKVPSLFGERDIIRSLQLLPGVKPEGDGSSGFQVRGGTSSQNLILLDDAPVYNAGHLLGIFSTFNDNALTNASLYKGQIPAQYGGATSSVFNVNTKTGDMQRFHLDGSIGLLSAKINIETPVVKDRLSCFVAARRTYFDLFLKATDDYRDTRMNFYDINAKINYKVTPNDYLFLSFFNGRDNLDLDQLIDMAWGNTTATLRWHHTFNERWSLSSSLYHSFYNSDNGVEIFDRDNSFDGFIRQSGLKENFTFRLKDKHQLNFGFQSALIDLKSAEWQIGRLNEKEKRRAWENTLWIDEEWKVNPKLGLSAGLRLNVFSVLGGAPYYELDADGNIVDTFDYGSGEFVKTYVRLEPRFSANYQLNDDMSVKLGYAMTSQNIQALRSNGTSLPFDRYTMSSNRVRPQTAHQASAGYIALTRNRMYEFSIEGYYKAISDVLDYRDGKSFNSEIEIERLVVSGKGRAYGVEMYARKNKGRFTGWAAYTLSWAENKIPGINNGRWYTANHDRRHDLSLVGMYELPKNWRASATWIYTTGQALTAPSAKYNLDGETVYYYAERNGYRAPAYHRLDVSFTHTKHTGKYTREWSFGFYNLYNHDNPYIISFESDDSKPSGTKTVQTSLFGIIPSVSFNFKF